MLLYSVIIIGLVYLSIGRIGNIKEDTELKVLMVFLWLMASLRAVTIGNDTQTYYNLFQRVCSVDNIFSLSGRYEVGYLILNRLVGYLTTNFTILLAVVNAIIYFAYYQFIKRYSANKVFSVFLFFTLGMWGQTMNIIRLQLAIAMMIYAFISRDDKKNIRAVLFALLAFSFHRLAIVFWVGLLIPKMIRKEYYILLTVATLVALVILPQLMALAAHFVPYFGTYLSSSSYVIGEVKLASLVGVLMRFAVLVVGLYIYRNNCGLFSIEEKENISLQINMVFISFLCMLVSLRFNLFDRCSYFFWVFALSLIPNAINYLRLKNNRLFFIIGVAVVCFAYFVIVNIYRPNWNHIFPYVTIFSIESY